MEGGEIGRHYAERRRDDKVIMVASRLQTELASCSRLECELSKIPAQKLSERPRHDEEGNGAALASRGPGAGARQASGATRPASIPPSSFPASSRAQGRQAGGFRCRTG